MIISNLSYLEDISETSGIVVGANCSTELIVVDGKVVQNTQSGNCSNVQTVVTTGRSTTPDSSSFASIILPTINTLSSNVF